MPRMLYPFRLDRCRLPQRQIRRQNFQCDSAIQFGILGQIHLTHSACAKLRENLIMLDSCPGREGHRFSIADQLSMTITGVEFASLTVVPIRKRWPSAVTSYSLAD